MKKSDAFNRLTRPFLLQIEWLQSSVGRIEAEMAYLGRPPGLPVSQSN